LERKLSDTELGWRNVTVTLDRAARTARFRVCGPDHPPPGGLAAIHAAGAEFWPLALARELDDAILHLRFNEPEIGTWILTSAGNAGRVAAADATLIAHAGDWLVREITLYLKRTLKRLELSSRSLIALIEPGSCFTGTLLELALAADRSYMLNGVMEDSNLPPPTIRLSAMNFGPLPMCTGLTRLQGRFLGDDAGFAAVEAASGRELDVAEAEALGLVTFAPDEIDWADEVRLAIEGRASLSPDALTAMEANLRFPGPETLESKIFARLSAWQNWVFQRPNAVGEAGALKLYGSGRRPVFDKARV
jgi:benzoyl-CoA-dihydrodiol lyase